MYAIVSLQGQQFRVEPGETLDVNRMSAPEGETVTMKESVLLAKDDDGLKVGSPLVDGATVELEVLEHFRSNKITVFKMKRRKRYRRKNGHRQEMTRVRVKEINLG